MSERKKSALEHTQRLLEAQHKEASEQERMWRALALDVSGMPIVVPISEVVELAVCENITPIPLTHPWIRGLTNLRGQLFTVIDLAVLLGSAETRLSRDARIILLADEGLNSCLLVSDVSGLKAFPEDQSRLPAGDMPARNAAYFSGQMRSDEKNWAVLNVPGLVADKRFRSPSRVQVQAI